MTDSDVWAYLAHMRNMIVEAAVIGALLGGMAGRTWLQGILFGVIAYSLALWGGARESGDFFFWWDVKRSIYIYLPLGAILACVGHLFRIIAIEIVDAAGKIFRGTYDPYEQYTAKLEQERQAKQKGDQ